MTSGNLTIEEMATTGEGLFGEGNSPIRAFNKQLTDKMDLMLDITSGLFLPIFVLGLAGNGFCLALLLPEIKKTSTYCYLFALSIFDSIYLFTQGTLWVVYSLSRGKFDIRTYIECNLVYILSVIPRICSSWILVIVSIERLVIVSNPIHGMQISKNVKIARWIIIGLVLIVAGLNWDCFGGYLTNRFESRNDVCPVREPIQHYVKVIKPWIVAVCYSYVPSLILCITNCAIIKVFRNSKLKVDVASTAGNAEVASISMAKKSKRVTILGIVLSVTYLVLTIPKSIVAIYAAVRNIQFQDDPIAYYNHLILHQAVSALALFNHGINFVLYIVTNELFRARFIKAITCKINEIYIGSQ